MFHGERFSSFKSSSEAHTSSSQTANLPDRTDMCVEIDLKFVRFVLQQTPDLNLDYTVHVPLIQSVTANHSFSAANTQSHRYLLSHKSGNTPLRQ